MALSGTCPPRTDGERDRGFRIPGLGEREEVLARAHRRRLVAGQPPEAADGSRSDLCAGTLAQGNDAPRELDEGLGRFSFNVTGRPSPEKVRRLVELLDNGMLRVPLQRRYPLAEAGKALQALTTSHTQGKLGIDIT